MTAAERAAEDLRLWASAPHEVTPRERASFVAGATWQGEQSAAAVDREALARIFMEHRVVLERGTTWLCRTCDQRWNPSLDDDMPFAEIDLHPFDMAVKADVVRDAAEVRREVWGKVGAALELRPTEFANRAADLNAIDRVRRLVKEQR